MATTPRSVKDAALNAAADALVAETERILSANAKDVADARTAGTPEHVIDRLALDAGRVAAFAQGVRDLAGLADPVGEIVRGSTLAHGHIIRFVGDRLYSPLFYSLALNTTPRVQVVPFRGDYYTLRPDARYLCHGLIYPVPDPAFPFLGVHLTRALDGSVHAGPNAVLALAREGYGWGTVSARDLAETLRWPGFAGFARKNWRTGVHEMLGSLSRRRFIAAAQKYVPDLSPEDVVVAIVDPQIYRITFLLVALVMTFVVYPLRRAERTRITWLDWVLSALSVVGKTRLSPGTGSPSSSTNRIRA